MLCPSCLAATGVLVEAAQVHLVAHVPHGHLVLVRSTRTCEHNRSPGAPEGGQSDESPPADDVEVRPVRAEGVGAVPEAVQVACRAHPGDRLVVVPRSQELVGHQEVVVS